MGQPCRVFVTGASGFLGRHVLDRAQTDRWDVIAPSSASVDIRDRETTIAAIRDATPDVVVHLAYRKDDRGTIVEGSENVALGAAAARARLIHMSTDLVFAGRPTPYVETDDPHPITGYGRDKLDAEHAVIECHPTAVIVRTSLLYGTTRPSPAQVELQHMLRSPAPEGGVMTFFTDEFRCPAHADDVARAIAEISSRSGVTGVLHVAGPERVSRAELARLMAGHLGLGDRPIPTSTIAESGHVRPADITLDVARATALGLACRPVSAVLG